MNYCSRMYQTANRDGHLYKSCIKALYLFRFCHCKLQTTSI
jgi:hypothetical protein